MSPVQWVQAHRRSVLFLLGVLAVSGIFAAVRLPVTLFPAVDFPRVVVAMDAGDRPADLMVLQVTVPVEEAIRRVPNVRSVRSRTSRGSAEVSINFDWGIDMALATSQINESITQILPTLPPSTSLLTRRMDPTVFPILAYSLTSSARSTVELRDLAEYRLRPLLSSVNGVARIQTLGGAVQEYQVMLDPARLQAYGLTFSDAATALAATNVVTAVGRLEDHYKLYLAVSATRLQSLEQIRETVIKTGADGFVRLKDVATVTDGTVPQWIKVKADGHDAVLLDIFQQPGSNSVQIAKDVGARLQAYQPQMPSGVKFANWYDQSRLVVGAAGSVRDAILIGVGLAALVLLVFLRDVRVTLIALMVVPAVLATTVVVLQVLGMSFNIMTLGGMAAAVGLIIDDAIVMVEHIVRRMQGAADGQEVGIMRSAFEFTRPLAGSSASTIVIFLPLAFLTGLTGAFFKALSITMASALIVSFLVTWLAVPILAERLLRRTRAGREDTRWIARKLSGSYAVLMGQLLRRPIYLLLAIVPLLVLGWVAYQKVGTGFMPSMDEGGFILDYRTAPGTSLTETDRLVRQVEAIVQASPNVDTYSRRTGTGLGGGLSEANEGDFFIRLKTGRRPSIDKVMEEIRTQVEHDVPGLDIELLQLMEDLIGDLTAVPQPIEVKLYSDDPAQLAAVAQRVVTKIAQIAGVVDTRNGINPAGDSLEVNVDPAKAALEGMNPQAITGLVGEVLAGSVMTQIQKGPKMVGVRAWVPESLRQTVDDVGKLMLRAPDGHVFALKRVAQISLLTGQPQINRDNLKRMVAVTGRISGRDLGSAIADLKRVLAEPGLIPRGLYYELGGLYEQQQIAFRGLLAVFIAAVALVFLLLLFMYESFRIAFAIMLMPLLAVAGVFVGLWATGIELNITSMMGLTMIVGIVTEVAIFYFSEYRDLSGTMEPRRALIEAGTNRMRPIAMTTLAAILTLLPLAFAIGEGSAMQQPLAVAIISGLMVQLPLVLVVMPVLFDTLPAGVQGWRAGPRAVQS